MDEKLKELLAAVQEWFRRDTPPVPVHLNTPIDSAVKDAEVLLAFAAQSRRSLKEDLINRLTAARATVVDCIEQAKPIPVEARSKFWSAYDELAVAMTPLSAHSIRSSLRINITRFPVSLFTPPAVLAVVAIIVFVLCIVIQSFWVSGKELLDKADVIEGDRVTLQKQIARADAARMTAEIKLRPMLTKLCEKGVRCQASGPSSPASGNGASHRFTADERAELSRVEAQADLLFVDSEERLAAIESYTRELTELNERGQAVTDLLGRWHGRISSICDASQYVAFLCLSSRPDEQAEVNAAVSALEKAREDLSAHYRTASATQAQPVTVPMPYSAPAAADMNRRRFESSRLQAAQRDAERALASARASHQRQTAHEVRIILGNLATYIVPLFMGLLGSLAFVLQALTTQLREHTYVQLSASASVVRLSLGAIAGVFGGLAPGSDGVLKGLPPLFIPFVFGYGIEILFSLLNRIVRTFTQSENGQHLAA